MIIVRKVMVKYILNNAFPIVLSALILSFFVSYENDKRAESLQRDTDRKETLAYRQEVLGMTDRIALELRDHEKRILILEFINIVNNKNLNEEQRARLYEYSNLKEIIGDLPQNKKP